MSRLALSLAIAVAAVGCAGQTPEARDARAAGEWTFRLPETHSPYASLAIGQGGQPSTLGLVDEALASSAGPERAVRQPKQRPAAQLAKTAPAAPQPVAAPAPEPVPAPQIVQAQPEQLALNTPPVTTSEEQRYSQRETQSQKQRDFRGGDAIVISASALVVILLVVILVLLLT